ncbi:MAG: ATP synthase F0 subunit B [Candidatus Doudnabacteria bacterium RIFCSPHIGHO2_01_FULL_50_11]|uniref:ATP synthase subunit b n=1 Tax=Candidatus Doudnabacteria bacterium RIFCSPHIGHO2_01_FULL_50_11 TaxID=1817828 RepID=A0A1F5PIT5_9BACT|nr:MAG: ATP synthase F0 subunit B [Candidatus Doudnabacteria bacterium RIFCSPHIGHO2_01_FULL_50_11]HLC44290.1 F0F1 ATP synthase subunit B [Patescibacteria group bacterium]
MLHNFFIAAAAEAVAPKQNAIELLGLNWKLFVAQLINFGIIVLVLWKWVFTPLTSAMQARTAKIEKSLHDAEDLKKKIAVFDAWKLEQDAKARVEYEHVVQQAQAAATEAKSEILEQAKLQSEKLVTDAEKRIGQERQAMVREAREELASVVIAVAEKVLKEKIDRPKDRELIEASLQSVHKR